MKTRRHHLLLRRARQQIASEHFRAELIIRHVAIQRANQPVTPRPDVHTEFVRSIPRRVRIACEVEPHPRPLFTVGARCEQPFHRVLVGDGRCFAGDNGNLLRRWRQPREVERNAPQQRQLLSLGRLHHPLLRELCRDEVIHLVARFRTRWQRRHRVSLRFYKRPMLRILSALHDPLAQNLRLGGSQRLVLLRWRHHLLLVLARDAQHHLTLRRVARHHRAEAITIQQRILPHIQTQLRLARLFIRPVAVKALARNHRQHIAPEIHAFYRTRLRENEGGNQSYSKFDEAK